MKDCGIVKDLLPLVAEHMASEESTAFVEEHLKTCADCRAAFDAMQAPVEAEPAAPLKTVRKAVKKRGWLIAGLIACLVAALIFGAFARLMKPIPITASEVAFAEATLIPETIPLPVSEVASAETTVIPETTVLPASTAEESPDPAPIGKTESDPKTDDELEMVKRAQQIIVVIDQNFEDLEIKYLMIDDAPSSESDPQSTEKPHTPVGFVIEAPQKQNEEQEIHGAVAYVYSAPAADEAHGQTIEPEAVIASTPRTLKLTPKWDTSLLIERNGNEISIGAYTSLWDMRHPHAETPQEISLSGVDAVFFEPYNNTDREVLYVRDGYTPEAGFALPRLVMNYYFLIAAIGTAILAVAWLVLRLCKKEKASRVLGVLLILAGSFVIAFLAAGFPATTIAPVRELAFVLVIALLLIGAGLCGRKLLRKE